MSTKPVFQTPEGEPIVVKQVAGISAKYPFALLIGSRIAATYRTEQLALNAARPYATGERR